MKYDRKPAKRKERQRSRERNGIKCAMFEIPTSFPDSHLPLLAYEINNGCEQIRKDLWRQYGSLAFAEIARYCMITKNRFDFENTTRRQEIDLLTFVGENQELCPALCNLLPVMYPKYFSGKYRCPK